MNLEEINKIDKLFDGELSIREKIDQKEYEVPFNPPNKNEPNYSDKLKDFAKLHAAKSKQFKIDLFEYFRIMNHTKAERLYNLSCKYAKIDRKLKKGARTHKLHRIMDTFEELVTLLK